MPCPQIQNKGEKTIVLGQWSPKNRLRALNVLKCRFYVYFTGQDIELLPSLWLCSRILKALSRIQCSTEHCLLSISPDRPSQPQKKHTFPISDKIFLPFSLLLLHLNRLCFFAGFLQTCRGCQLWFSERQ